LNNNNNRVLVTDTVIAAKQKKEEQEVVRNKIPYMICESQNIKIKCQSLMEAEQRARIYHEESKHEVIWRFEEEEEE
jgi:hypothetical protein